jgi:hypothetical protein
MPPHHHKPPSGHPGGHAPSAAPPDYIPAVPLNQGIIRAVEPGAISRCLFNNTYVWLTNGQQFWFFPTFIGRRSISGFRWMHRNWVYMGFDLNMVESFVCG